MENKKLYIGLGVLAIAGIGIYLYHKNKNQDNKIDWKKTNAEIAKEFGLDLDQVIDMRKKAEGKSSASGAKIVSISNNNLASTASKGTSSSAKGTACPKDCTCVGGVIQCGGNFL